MTVTLSSTWEDLAALVGRPSDPLAIMGVMNRFSPRDWRFEFTFDGDQRVILDISATPTLTQEDVEQLADGTIPEVFSCEELYLLSNELCHVGDIAGYMTTPPPTNHLELANCVPPAQMESGLRLVGYFGTTLSASLGNPRAVAAALRESTWFDSSFRRGHARRMTWHCLAQQFVHTQGSNWTSDLSSDAPFFNTEAPLLNEDRHCGNARLVWVEDERAPLMRHSRFGTINPQQIKKGFWKTLPRTGGTWSIEIDEPYLNVRPGRDCSPFPVALEILDAVSSAVSRVALSDTFRQFQDNAESRRIERTAVALHKRQRAALERPKVFLGRRELMCVPRGETEVLALLGKLEILEALPLALFRLNEYTPKAGIDALANYQISPQGRLHVQSPVELEYSFENFFAHGHSLAQAGLIICWCHDGERLTQPIQILPGLYKYTEEFDTAHVIVLSEIRNLEVKDA